MRDKSPQGDTWTAFRHGLYMAIIITGLLFGLMRWDYGKMHPSSSHQPHAVEHSTLPTYFISASIPSCHILVERFVQHHRGLSLDRPVLVTVRPSERWMDSAFQSSRLAFGEKIVDVFALNREIAMNKLSSYCPQSLDFHSKVDLAGPIRAHEIMDVVVNIHQSGDPSNRIDLVFIGDGYTAEEYSKFIADAKRLTKDMFTGPTFRSVLPLFNIWALFRPSQESGIGVFGMPRNTSFGLYRDGTELRGIYCAKKHDVRRVCHRLDAQTKNCDFPVLLANDDFYGGLGGEFVIGTRSVTTGTMVIRHEMGHSLGWVGDEYDGGSYLGANSDADTNEIPWKHWVEPEHMDGGEIQKFDNALRVQDYSWYDLSKGAYELEFTSDGTYARWYLQISVSGADFPDSFVAFLDGVMLPWNTTGNLDRAFFSWEGHHGFSAGRHTLRFVQGDHDHTGLPPRPRPIVQLCSVNLHEYPANYPAFGSPPFVAAFPSRFDMKKDTPVHWRPTDESCLMRNMTSAHFCPICKESLWLELASRVRLIDGVKVSTRHHYTHHTRLTFDQDVYVSVIVPPIGQYRLEDRIGQEYLHISWLNDGEPVIELDGLLKWVNKREKVFGNWTVKVTYETDEVRKDTNHVLVDSYDFEIQ